MGQLFAGASAPRTVLDAVNTTRTLTALTATSSTYSVLTPSVPTAILTWGVQQYSAGAAGTPNSLMMITGTLFVAGQAVARPYFSWQSMAQMAYGVWSTSFEVCHPYPILVPAGAAITATLSLTNVNVSTMSFFLTSTPATALKTF